MGGIGLRYCLGCGTPSGIAFKIPARLPSLHNHLPPARLGPRGEPIPFAPWDPAQAAPPTSPSYIRSPSATMSRVAPSGTGMFAFAPASSFVPSGGFALASAISPAGAVELGQGAPRLSPVPPPRYTIR